MILSGIIEASTIDWRGHVSTVFFFPKCNGTCEWCHNAKAMQEIGTEYSNEQIFKLLKTGISDSIVISGGEPTLFKDDGLTLMGIADELGLSIMINTNGSLPLILKTFIETGLVEMVSIDVKTAFNDKYFEMTGINHSNVSNSISLCDLYHIPTELRTTVCNGVVDADEVLKIAIALKNTHFDFILQQYKHSEGVDSPSLSKSNEPTHEQMLNLGKIAHHYISSVYIRDGMGLEKIA